MYWEARIAAVVADIEKFKLDEHIIEKAEANKSQSMLSKEELAELKANHASTNMVQLNSKLNSRFLSLSESEFPFFTHFATVIPRKNLVKILELPFHKF